MDFESDCMSRKRKNCDRDDYDDNSPSTQGVEEPRTILQEADSTTTVGVDKADMAMIVDTALPASPISSDLESEQSATKKHRASSPEAVVPVVVRSGTGGLVSSALNESEQVQNMSTGQSEPLVEN